MTNRAAMVATSRTPLVRTGRRSNTRTYADTRIGARYGRPRGATRMVSTSIETECSTWRCSCVVTNTRDSAEERPRLCTTCP